MSEGESDLENQAGGRLPLPFALSMMFCDSITVDLATGKFSLNGCFDKLFAPNFPAAHPSMMLFIAMTNGHGNMTVRIQLVDVDEQNDPLFKLEGPIQFPDPLAIVDLRLSIPLLVFPQAGEYRMQLLVDEQFVAERRLTLGPVGGFGS